MKVDQQKWVGPLLAAVLAGTAANTGVNVTGQSGVNEKLDSINSTLASLKGDFKVITFRVDQLEKR